MMSRTLIRTTNDYFNLSSEKTILSLFIFLLNFFAKSLLLPFLLAATQVRVNLIVHKISVLFIVTFFYI